MECQGLLSNRYCVRKYVREASTSEVGCAARGIFRCMDIATYQVWVRGARYIHMHRVGDNTNSDNGNVYVREACST